MRFHRATLVGAIALAVIIACGDDDPAPPPSASPAPTAPSATATPSAFPTRTPQPTMAAPRRSVIFCEAEQDGFAGFTRHEDDSSCSGGGFSLDSLSLIAEGAAVGDFVPWCYQRAEGEGLRIIVGSLCLQEGSLPTFTLDPRPDEVRDLISDGDLVPFCAYEFADYPDYPITIGPPCILRGIGFISMAIDTTPIEGKADCTAGFTYFSLSEAALRQLLDLLPTDSAEVFDSSSPAITEASTVLSAPAPERVARFFAPWADQSPIEMNAAIVTALEALENGDAAALEALRTQIQDAINWYSAGRGC